MSRMKDITLKLPTCDYCMFIYRKQFSMKINCIFFLLINRHIEFMSNAVYVFYPMLLIICLSDKTNGLNGKTDAD